MDKIFSASHLNISDMENGTLINDIYIISDISVSVTKAGSPYLRASLRDNSGKISMKIWDYTNGRICPTDNGKLIAVIGKVSSYEDSLQVYVEQAEVLSFQDYCNDPILNSVIPHALIDVESIKTYFSEQIASIRDKDLYDITSLIVSRNYELFLKIPASKDRHHDYLNGLLVHTCSMLQTANLLSSVYKDIVNRDLLISGVILHDIGKLRVFKLADTGLVSDYISEDGTIGHSVLGAMEVMSTAEEIHAERCISEALSHLILSHHSFPDKDVIKEPMVFEAELLNYTDSIDITADIYRKSVKDIVYSKPTYIPLLNKQIYRHPIDLISTPKDDT